MIRTCRNFCNKNFLRIIIEKHKDVFVRTCIVPHQTLSESPYSTQLLNVQCYNIQNFRHKSKSSKRRPSESDSDSYNNEEFIDKIQDKNTKVLNINVTSLRVDAILKSALGMARNKIETLFYESKIRVNGDKISKKSATVQLGDEIDLLKGPDLKNPNFINVARVEILSVKPDDDSISIKIRRCKSLTIEPY